MLLRMIFLILIIAFSGGMLLSGCSNSVVGSNEDVTQEEIVDDGMEAMPPNQPGDTKD